MTSESTAGGGATMTIDTLFTLRMFPAQSEEQAREIAAQGGTTQGGLELRILPVDAAGQATTVTSPEEVERVMLDLSVLPAATAEAGDTSGHQFVTKLPSNPDPRPMAPSRVLQIAPGVALRLPVTDPMPGDDQDTQGFIYGVVALGVASAFIVGVPLGYGSAALGAAAGDYIRERYLRK